MTMLGAIGAWLLSVGGEEERYRPPRRLAGSRVLSAPQSCRVFKANLTRRWHRGTVAPVSVHQLADHRRGPADGRCKNMGPSPQCNVDRVPWPFRGCTITEVDVAAQGAQLPAPPEAVLCAECRGTVFHNSHYEGRRHAPQAGPAADGRGHAGEVTTLSDAELAAFCLRRLRDNPRFAALLTASAEPSPAPTVTEAGARDTADVRADQVLDWTIDL
ncbi:hypothetical protein HPB50_008199 [Hyalomma asiaticum]|uniref:Uncharacterized protein n=1 Tax=Hyalomma asiaticum TaxID=266040 RepID=A0ACB7SDH6_HYAAI|nr:hypothetical protein HPB50_008199 [Hyalomma asiaticum]